MEAAETTDEVRIVRQWAQSTYIYGADSKQRVPNPDAHPLICQREDGRYCDVEGRIIARSAVPAYIREEGRPLERTEPVGGTISLADAMKDAITPADPRDQRARQPAKGGKRK